ncbi:MAG: hypothetical protein H6745_19700 [Deltaproteobacteria bacterium]|nr:hypothetical protein [Deltaproteobacteria bacterium]
MELTHLLGEAEVCEVPEIALQTLALLTLARGRSEPSVLAAARKLETHIQRERRARRLDVMSLEEALQIVGA